MGGASFTWEIIFWHAAVEGLVLTKPAYITPIPQQVETKRLKECALLSVIKTKAPRGQKMALGGLCVSEREREPAQGLS